MIGEQLNDFLMVMHEDSVGTVCCSHFAVVTRNRNRVVQYLWIVCTPAYPTTSALLQMCNDVTCTLQCLVHDAEAEMHLTVAVFHRKS